MCQTRKTLEQQAPILQTHRFSCSLHTFKNPAAG